MGKTFTKKEWFELTWKAEKKAHGNSSGVDPAAVVYGGLLVVCERQEWST
jgi:mevalonate kinase